MSDERDRRDDDLRERVRGALDGVYRPAPGLLRRCAEAVARDRRRHRLPRPVAWTALVVIAATALVATLVQHSIDRGVHGPVATASPNPSARQLVFALTAANQVVALDRSTLRPRWRTQVAAPPAGTVGSGSTMALSPDAATLYVLTLADDRGGSGVVLLDTATGRQRGTVQLSAPGGALYRSLAVQGQSGTLYAVGQDQGHILVTAVDPGRRVVLATQVTRTLPAARPVGPDRPTDAMVTADGSRLYYSYGGSADRDRTGIDWANLAGPRITPCRSGSGAACIPGPGNPFGLENGHVYFADGSIPENLVDATATGSVVRRSPTTLAGGTTAVLVDAATQRAVVIGDCANLGGLSTADLGSGRVQTVSTPAPAGGEPGPETVCGQSPVFLTSQSLAVSRISGDNASPQSPGTVDVVDLATGRILRSAALPAEVADLLVAG